ncbi:MAG: ATP-binding protein [Motiliproteus sp.]|nr:ATP-binding protein [Motiliproteus sp.]MCW9052365.1 ATP-binding protein [Motiliproteus sp.]
MRSKVFLKLLLALLLTLLVIVALTLLVVNWSFQSGFVNYLRQAETQRVTVLANHLEQQFVRYGDWDFIQGGYRQWKQTLESVGISPPPPLGRGGRRRPPPPMDRAEERGPPPFFPAQDLGPKTIFDERSAEEREQRSPEPPSMNEIPFGGRIALFDVDREQIQGPRIPTGLLSWIAIESAGETVGWLGLKPVSIASDELSQSFVVQQRDSFVVVTIAALLVSLVVAALLARRFLTPIHRVADAAKQVAKGDFRSRVAVHGNDELAELAGNFNHMAQQLERNEQLRRQWLSDISHELRTPTALISAQVEAMQDGIVKPNPTSLASLYSDIGSLGKLMEDLHQLSVSDQFGMTLQQEEVDLFCLIQSQIVSFQPRAHEQELSLVMDTDWSARFVVLGDENRLTQLMVNLLVNSIRYTDQGGRIVIRLLAHADQVQVVVLDDPPGVPEQELDRIFERLYRVDKSRSRLAGGSGLGLSICRNIVKAHSGSIQAENRSEGGLKITVTLPRSTQSVSGISND